MYSIDGCQKVGDGSTLINDVSAMEKVVKGLRFA